MKLTIGENIRSFRRKNDMTQEQLAQRLGVTYQSVSRWENGTTYPDLELLPAISELLSVTVDELIGMPQYEKEKSADEAFDELSRECMKESYDAEKIEAILSDIRRNYIGCNRSWRLWIGNERAYRDPKILPEVRLTAEEYLKKHPMNSHVIQTMANIEDEEHLDGFLKNNTTALDCSKRKLLFDRYLRLGDEEKFEPERRYQLWSAVSAILFNYNLVGINDYWEKLDYICEFQERFIDLMRDKPNGNEPDIWSDDRLYLGFARAHRLAKNEKYEEAMDTLSDCVELLENIMKLQDDAPIPTSCSWLDGMEWEASVRWESPTLDPDGAKEKGILLSSFLDGISSCFNIFPSRYVSEFDAEEFDAVREDERFVSLLGRVKALVIVEK